MFGGNAIALLLSALCCADGLNYTSMALEVVMRAGDAPIPEMDEVHFPTFHNGACTVRFPRDGNWATQNGFFTGGWDANRNSQCRASGLPSMTYKLQTNGNFVAYCGPLLDYGTNTGKHGVGDYFLAIDGTCVLHLFKGTLNCNGVHIEKEIWTNVQDKPLGVGSRLGKGEMVRNAATTLVMQSSDGNLVLYEGDGGDKVVLWAANQEWRAPPAAMYREYYAKVTNTGYLQLVGKEFQYGTEKVYFKKYLGVKSGCFTVEYNGVDNLLAVPCP